MTYQDQAELAADVPFLQRIGAAVAEEAKGHDDYLADLTLRQPSEGAAHFMPFLSTAPGFGDKYASGGSKSILDGEILAAVQANWAAVSALWPEPPADAP